MPKGTSGVYVEFILTNGYFIFLHNGLPFEKENVSAIADAGKSTKPYDWQLYDSEKDDVIDDGSMDETNQDAIDTAMDNLFPDGEGEEGFDVDKHFGLD